MRIGKQAHVSRCRAVVLNCCYIHSKSQRRRGAFVMTKKGGNITQVVQTMLARTAVVAFRGIGHVSICSSVH